MSELPQAENRITEVEYLAFEMASESRHEYRDGEVHALTGASRYHNLICTNIVATLHAQLKTAPCEIYQSAMRVLIEPTRLLTYPDVVVVCGEPQFAQDMFDTLLNPVLLVEVLAPATEDYDLGKKSAHYRQIPTVQDVLFIAQDSPRVEHYQRHPEGRWLLHDILGLEARIDLLSIPCTLALASIYARMTFDTDAPYEAESPETP